MVDTLENEPGCAVWHVVKPSAVLYVPGEHVVHEVALPSENEPRGQTVSVVELQNEPAGHGVQNSTPLALLYDPATQSIQTPSEVRSLVPAGHK